MCTGEITFSTDNRMSHSQSRYDLVFFKIDGVPVRYTELTREQQAAANKIYPVTFEARRTICDHQRVTVKWKLYAMETRYEPAEYIGKALCDDCGEEMEPEDVPAETERKDVTI